MGCGFARECGRMGRGEVPKMTIIEAVQSGKPFSRRGCEYSAQGSWIFTHQEILADDWVVRKENPKLKCWRGCDGTLRMVTLEYAKAKLSSMGWAPYPRLDET